MRIVINIPERIYYGVEKGITVNGSKASQIVLDAVKNGILLPEGHGRLIDAKVAYKKFYSRCYASVAEEILNEVPTIIEADKGDEE